MPHEVAMMSSDNKLSGNRLKLIPVSLKANPARVDHAS